jgi:GntR family transcriptional regulator, transcriptional repressor for pyruvate dehydrogenase complex
LARKSYRELRPTGARLAADRLRERIMELEEGAYLGSEDDLSKFLGVGRHTLRQTARLLEHERLLKVKRGVRGGYYAIRPDVDAVADAAAIYLRSRSASTPDLYTAAAVLDVELARLAAISANEDARARLADLEHRLRGATVTDRNLLAELEQEFRDCVFALAGNAFIELMLRIQARLAHRPPRLSQPDDPQRTRDHQERRARLAAAILDRDPDMAMLIARRTDAILQAEVAAECAEGRRARDAGIPTPGSVRARSAKP